MGKRPRRFPRPRTRSETSLSSDGAGFLHLSESGNAGHQHDQALSSASQGANKDLFPDGPSRREDSDRDSEIAGAVPAMQSGDLMDIALADSHDDTIAVLPVSPRGGATREELVEEREEDNSVAVATTGTRKGSLCSSSVYREEAFPDAGKGEDTDCPEMADMVHGYFPFKGRRSYAMAKWLYESKTTQGKVDEYFKDPRNKRSHLCFSNGRGWLRRLETIPHGIKDDDWTTEHLTIPLEFSGVKTHRVMFVYRDILRVIRFLLGYRPFKEELVYAPVRHFNSKDERMFSEMHTGDWWWRTQLQLPPKATLVPLLLATDKTMLTKHRGDLAAWPVYATIGNLKAEARRSQKRPGLVLLGLLPVFEVEGKATGIKARMWHHCIGEMLKRKR